MSSFQKFARKNLWEALRFEYIDAEFRNYTLHDAFCIHNAIGDG